MNWETHEKNLKGCTIVKGSSKNIERSSPISHEMKETSEVQIYVKLESHEIYGTFDPPYLSPFPTRVFDKRLGFK